MTTPQCTDDTAEIDASKTGSDAPARSTQSSDLDIELRQHEAFPEGEREGRIWAVQDLATAENLAARNQDFAYTLAHSRHIGRAAWCYGWLMGYADRQALDHAEAAATVKRRCP